MISRPLFISVAESIVTFGPIDQLGWRRACSGVAARIASADQVRNGPPEAVNTMRWIFSRVPAASDWKMALCSESTGKTVAPAAAARRMNSVPAQTSVSLLAGATLAPPPQAGGVGRKPAARGTQPITHPA